MCKTADLLAETEEYLEEQTENALKECVTDMREALPEDKASEKEIDRVELDVEKFLTFHSVIQKRMLLVLSEKVSPTGKDIEAVHIRDMLALFTREGNRKVSLPMGIVAYRQYGKAVLERGNQVLPEEAELPELEFSVILMKNGQEVPRNQYTKWFDYDKMKEPPVLRFRQTGDFLTVADGKGQVIHKSLKDYMITEKIPREMRDRIPVLAEGSHVLWLIGYRISEYYKVDRNTKRVLQVKLKRDCMDGETEEKNGRTHQSTFIRK